EGVDHVLAGLHVAGDHGGGRGGVEHGAVAGDDPQGLEAASVERDVVVDQGAEDVEGGGVDDGGRRVEVAGELVGRGREVERGLTGGVVDRDGHGDLAAAVH